ncbi:MAG: 3-deoxy-7-phosphoheptulonate synthase [Elusimicrobia bacterium]|nr:3-deoxy-7-phosphoheptulonate synthase [Elusimicrobiota bacterium]
MLIRLEPGAEAAALRGRVARLLPGATVRAGQGVLRVATRRPERLADALPRLESLPGVASAEPTLAEACPRASRAKAPSLRAFRKDGPILIAGPCSLEDGKSYLAAARRLKAAGATALRAGVFKPRSSPYAFPGLGEKAFPILREARRETGLPLVSEVLSERQLETVLPFVDMVQIGARNMRNYELLKAAAAAGLPVLLKRAPGATLKDWLLCAEYLLRYGDGAVVLCERGDSYSGSAARGLDLAMIRAAVAATGLPVIADPSHANGERARVPGQALAALRAGAAGLLIEACADPVAALVDGRHTISLDDFGALAGRI